jgi:hypothetical protein
MRNYIYSILLVLVAASSTCAFAIPTVDKPDVRTAAAVLAVDNAWGDAEADGDAAFVAKLLEPGYRSIGANGKTTSRDTIIENTRRHAGSSEYRTKVTTW